MKAVIIFINIIAWALLLLALVRVLAVTFWGQNRTEVRIAEALGYNPIGNAIAKALGLALLCGAWLLSQHLVE